MVTINLSPIKNRMVSTMEKKKNKDMRSNHLSLMDLLNIELIELEFFLIIYHKKISFILWTRKCQHSWESIKTLKGREMSLLLSTVNIWNMISRETWIKKLEKLCQRELLKHLKISTIIKKRLRFCWAKANKQMRILSLFKTRQFKWESIKTITLVKQWMSQRRTSRSSISKTKRNKLSELNSTQCRPSLEIYRSTMNRKMLTTLTSKTYWNSKKI